MLKSRPATYPHPPSSASPWLEAIFSCSSLTFGVTQAPIRHITRPVVDKRWLPAIDPARQIRMLRLIVNA